MRIIFRILLTYMQICIKISIMTDSKEMIKKLGLTPNKALGQNFLIDTEAISRIAALADCQGENVLEIGPGLGALTSALSEKAKNLLAVEIDRTLVGILADEFADKRSVQLICSDFLKISNMWRFMDFAIEAKKSKTPASTESRCSPIRN